MIAEARATARLAGPIALAQVGLIAMSLVVMATVGRVSVHDLAAASMGRTIAFASGSLGMGVGLALDPLAGQAVGAGAPGRAWAALRTALRGSVLATLAGVALAFAATLALAPIGVDPALVHSVRVYLCGHAPGIFCFVVFMAGKGFLQAHGETRPAIVAAALGTAVTAVACNLLVRGDEVLGWAGLPPLGIPRLGALGAGIATSIGSLVLAAVVLAAVRRRRPPRPTSPEDAVPLSTALRLGIPVGLQILAETGVFTVVGVLAGRLGAPVVSAHQIALGLASFAFMSAIGVGAATAVRVGHAIGAGVSPRRVGVVGLLMIVGVMSVSAAIFATVPRPLIALFSPDAGVIALAVPLLGIAAAFQLFDGVQAVAAGALRGAGDVRFAFLVNVGAHWLLGFPLSLALCFGVGLGARGLWIGITAGLVVTAVLLTARFLHLSRGNFSRV